MQEEEAITEVKVPDQQTDEILLIDSYNRQNEAENVTDKACEDEFDGSDDDHCTDIDENPNNSE